MIASLDKQAAPGSSRRDCMRCSPCARERHRTRRWQLPPSRRRHRGGARRDAAHWWAYALLPSLRGLRMWGILERATAERETPRSASYDRAIGAAQWIAAAIGTACAIVTVFAVLGVFLGTIIS